MNTIVQVKLLGKEALTEFDEMQQFDTLTKKEDNYYLNSSDPDELIDYSDVDNSAAFVVEPGVNLEINLVKFLRFSAGISYRYIYGTKFDVVDITDEDLSNLSFNASFKFGFF